MDCIVRVRVRVRVRVGVRVRVSSWGHKELDMADRLSHWLFTR